jgi:hypothetical protein
MHCRGRVGGCGPVITCDNCRRRLISGPPTATCAEAPRGTGRNVPGPSASRAAARSGMRDRAAMRPILPSARSTRPFHSPGGAATEIPGVDDQMMIRLGGYSPRPVALSRARSAAAAGGPAVFSTPGDGGVRGCGRVGAVFLPCSILAPISLASSADKAFRSGGQTCVSS